ncbi:MAG: hypothetical protein JNL17_16050 [Cyclobacteriaceae bacterium]|nr:hypothetical protein [Cyclobacteriaceae bacterium]
MKITAIANNNKDVVVLSYLIRDYMRKTDSVNFRLTEILKGDTLGRVAINFSEIEIDYWSNLWYGGYAVYFKFSKERNRDSVQLTQYERIPWKVKMRDKIGKKEELLTKDFDGVIHFYYPERFYSIAEIIVRGSPN